MLLVTNLDCGGADILRVIKMALMALDIIFFVVPFILIVMISVDFVKSVLSGKDDDVKKNLNIVIRRILACIVMFLVPTIVNILTNMIGTDYSKCITLAKNVELFEYKTVQNYGEENNDNPNATGGGNSKTTKNSNINKNSTTTKTTTKKVTTTKTTTVTKQDSDDIKNIFIGDSRCVGIQNSIDKTEKNKSEWICEVSKGYNWFKSTAINTLNSKIKPNQNYNIYINLGVNDVYNVSSYITYFNNMKKNSKYSNCNIIIVSVNPVEDSKAKSNGYMITNNDVINFNSKMKRGLDSSISYCDVYDKINKSFQTVDGLHYNNSTSKIIYNHIISCK